MLAIPGYDLNGLTCRARFQLSIIVLKTLCDESSVGLLQLCCGSADVLTKAHREALRELNAT